MMLITWVLRVYEQIKSFITYVAMSIGPPKRSGPWPRLGEFGSDLQMFIKNISWYVPGNLCQVKYLTAAVYWLCKGSVIPSFLIRSLLKE